MLRWTPVLVLVAVLCFPAPGQDDPAGGSIAWCRDLEAGLQEAKAKERILMVCVNAKQVEGEAGEEPAAKGLREVVYRDPRIVARSRDFVCVLLTPTSSMMDYAELGNLGMNGRFISPQHIFISPQGDRILFREEYWPHGKGEKAVKALLDMMRRAEREAGVPEAPEDPVPGEDGSPAGGEERAAWIADLLEDLDGDLEQRDRALAALVRADRDGDCTGPLIELLGRSKRKPELLRDLIRALGRDGLVAAAEPIGDFLGHKEPTIRANAAVSLEYIGCRDKEIVSALLKAAGREKDEAIANHMCRALGRCGAESDSARELLLKMTAGAKSEFASFGPIIGLAYFETDEKARRGVEKLLGQIGVPGGGRGGMQNNVKRVLLSWTLAWIGDGKSAVFVREVLLAKLENVTAFWVEGMRMFWEGVAAACEGDGEAMAVVDGGVRRTVGFAGRWSRKPDGSSGLSLKDEARDLRDGGGFEPRGEGLLEATGPGEGPGGPGGPGEGPGGPGGRPGRGPGR